VIRSSRRGGARRDGAQGRAGFVRAARFHHLARYCWTPDALTLLALALT
jgi:hypothetical protein